jgi:signal transduction histidine kinase
VKTVRRVTKTPRRYMAAVLRPIWRVLRRIVIGKDPPTLRDVLFRVILVTVCIPVALFVWANPQQSQQNNLELQSLQRSFQEGHTYPNPPAPAADFEQMKKVVLMNGPARGESSEEWPLSSLAWNSLAQTHSLPPSVLTDLQTKGYSYGDCLFMGQKARFAAWHAPTASDNDLDSFHMVVAQPWAWYWSLARWGMQLLMLLALLCVIASPAAWFLERQIARPVFRLAEASKVVASGGHPVPLPAKGPAELLVLSDSFNHMANELDKAQAAERDFLLSVSHELKTPLTAIEGYAELLGDEAVTAKEAAPVLISEAKRLRRLVSDLLDLAKINQSSFSIRHEPVLLAAVVEEVTKRHKAEAKELGVELISVSSGAAGILGDEDRLVQALSNLLENALRCTPRGKTVSVNASGTRVAVSDEGPGLSAEDLPHAFERFYLHSRLKGQNNVGSGLGLAIVKELIDRMGGEVTVESELGRGSRFAAEFPPGPTQLDSALRS